MQIKDVLVALAIPAIVSSAAIPQDPTFPEGEFPDEPIVGGESAVSGDFPFIVSIQRSSGSHFCGGTLLNANTVLTAAHCAEGQTASAIRIRAGSLNRASGGTVAGVSSIRIHPNYGVPQYNNDVAILKLSTSIPTSSTIKYAVLASSGSDPAAGSSSTVAGWGTTRQGTSTSPTNLLKVTVPIISRSSCRSSYGSSRITDNMVCAGLSNGGKDSCQGDSGGPLIDTSSQTLLGVVSWGEGCAQPNAPGVYARVGSLNSWISGNL